MLFQIKLSSSKSMYGGIGLWLGNSQVEVGRSEVQSLGTDYFREFEASLSYVRFYLKKKDLI